MSPHKLHEEGIFSLVILTCGKIWLAVVFTVAVGTIHAQKKASSETFDTTYIKYTHTFPSLILPSWTVVLAPDQDFAQTLKEKKSAVNIEYVRLFSVKINFPKYTRNAFWAMLKKMHNWYRAASLLENSPASNISRGEEGEREKWENQLAAWIFLVCA